MFDLKVIWDWVTSIMFVDKTGVLIEDEVVEDQVDLNTFTKDQLIEYAQSQGVDVKKGWTKSAIISHIESAK